MATPLSETELLWWLCRDASRRGPGNDDLARRVGLLCDLTEGQQVLDLGCGPGATARLLAREFGCQVTCADVDEAALDALAAGAQHEGFGDLIETMQADISTFDLPPVGFNALVYEEGISYPGNGFLETVQRTRRLLAPNGRLAISALARVGRTMPAAVSDFYRERGETLKYPLELAQLMERAGFEPLAAEVYADSIIEDWYRFVEQALNGASERENAKAIANLRREIDLYRTGGARFCVAVVLLVGRRKEPHETPPATQGND